MSEVGNWRDLGSIKEDHLTYHPEMGRQKSVKEGSLGFSRQIGEGACGMG